jgi:hypothetical protein
MARTNHRPEPTEASVGAWIAFWLQFAVLGLLAVLGLFFAGADAQPGDDCCGLILAVAAVLLALLRIKARFDGADIDWDSFLFVDDMANLVLAIVVFVILGVGGVIVAAGVGGGGLYAGGVALFAVSAIAVLLSMKQVFDKLDHSD